MSFCYQLLSVAILRASYVRHHVHISPFPLTLCSRFCFWGCPYSRFWIIPDVVFVGLVIHSIFVNVDGVHCTCFTIKVKWIIYTYKIWLPESLTSIRLLKYTLSKTPWLNRLNQSHVLCLAEQMEPSRHISLFGRIICFIIS